MEKEEEGKRVEEVQGVMKGEEVQGRARRDKEGKEEEAERDKKGRSFGGGKRNKKFCR